MIKIDVTLLLLYVYFYLSVYSYIFFILGLVLRFIFLRVYKVYLILYDVLYETYYKDLRVLFYIYKQYYYLILAYLISCYNLDLFLYNLIYNYNCSYNLKKIYFFIIYIIFKKMDDGFFYICSLIYYKTYIDLNKSKNKIAKNKNYTNYNFELNLNCPSLSIYEGLESSFFSVSVRFMGFFCILMIFFIIFFNIYFNLYILNFYFILLFLLTLWVHNCYVIKHSIDGGLLL